MKKLVVALALLLAVPAIVRTAAPAGDYSTQRDTFVYWLQVPRLLRGVPTPGVEGAVYYARAGQGTEFPVQTVTFKVKAGDTSKVQQEIARYFIAKGFSEEPSSHPAGHRWVRPGKIVYIGQPKDRVFDVTLLEGYDPEAR